MKIDIHFHANFNFFGFARARGFQINFNVSFLLNFMQNFGVANGNYPGTAFFVAD
jgi:hypothetical protein